MRRNHQSIDTT